MAGIIPDIRKRVFSGCWSGDKDDSKADGLFEKILLGKNW